MASFHIAFDNLDIKLGLYFEESKTDIVNFITGNNPNHTINELNSELCTVNHINECFQGSENPYLFIAYSHGNNNCLVIKKEWYVSSPENTQNFANSFFYSMSCNTGKDMGIELIEKGCLVFIGYKSTAYAALDEHKDLFIECDNYGLKRFIEGSSAKNAFAEMKSNYRQAIKGLVKKKKTLLAGYLRSNLGALVFYSNNDDLHFNDFN